MLFPFLTITLALLVPMAPSEAKRGYACLHVTLYETKVSHMNIPHVTSLVA